MKSLADIYREYRAFCAGVGHSDPQGFQEWLAMRDRYIPWAPTVPRGKTEVAPREGVANPLKNPERMKTLEQIPRRKDGGLDGYSVITRKSAVPRDGRKMPRVTPPVDSLAARLIALRRNATMDDCATQLGKPKRTLERLWTKLMRGELPREYRRAA